MKRIYRTYEKPAPNWIPHEYLLKADEDETDLPTSGVPAGSIAYVAGGSQAWQMSEDGAWTEIETPTINVIGDAAISISGHKLVITTSD